MSSSFRFLASDEIACLTGPQRARYLEQALETIKKGYQSDPQYRLPSSSERLTLKELDQLLHLQQIAYLKRSIRDLTEHINRLMSDNAELQHDHHIIVANMRQAIYDMARQIGEEVDRQRGRG